MQQRNDTLLFSASDLSSFAACPQLSLLARGRARGEVPAPPQYEDVSLDVLRQRGEQHEQQVLQRYREAGLRVAEIPREGSYEDRAGLTRAALQQGYDVVYQGCLYDARWLGFPDFLRRVPYASALGDWSYEVVDAKLAREAKAGALLQVCLYSHLLQQILGEPPRAMHLELGGPEAMPTFFPARNRPVLAGERRGDRTRRAVPRPARRPAAAPAAAEGRAPARRGGVGARAPAR
jgi:predicted RecB family nuclease